MSVITVIRPQENPTTESRPEAEAPARSESGVAWFFVLLAAFAGLHVYVMGSVPLTGDEAYYWQWSRHLAPGYYDHPPMIAWSVAFFNALCGISLFSTRLAGPVYSALTTIFIYLLGRDVSGFRRIGALAGTLFLLAPLPAIGGMAIVPDAPMMTFWAASLYFLHRALFREQRWAWGAAGVCMGLGIMSKLMALFLLPSLFVFLALSKAHRPLLRRPEPYLAIGAALLVASPFLLWNAAHGWETFSYQATSRLHMEPSAKYFVDFVAFEAAYLSPGLFLLSMASLAYLLVVGYRRQEPRYLFLGSFCACILAFFLAISFRTRTGGHWPFPGYISLMCGIALLWQRSLQPGGRETLKKFYRGGIAVSVAVAALFTMLVYALVLKPDLVFAMVSRFTVQSHGINKGHQVQSKELAEIYGYEELGSKVAATVAEMSSIKPTFVITDSYSLSSIIAFYSGVPTHVALGSILGREYLRWDRFDDYLGQDALYVDLSPYGTREDITRMLSGAFESVTPDPPMQVYKDGQPVRSFYLVRCHGFRRNLFRPEGARH